MTTHSDQKLLWVFKHCGLWYEGLKYMIGWLVLIGSRPFIPNIGLNKEQWTRNSSGVDKNEDPIQRVRIKWPKFMCATTVVDKSDHNLILPDLWFPTPASKGTVYANTTPIKWQSVCVPKGKSTIADKHDIFPVQCTTVQWLSELEQNEESRSRKTMHCNDCITGK